LGVIGFLVWARIWCARSEGDTDRRIDRIRGLGLPVPLAAGGDHFSVSPIGSTQLGVSVEWMLSPLRVAVISAPDEPKMTMSGREPVDPPAGIVTVAGTATLVGSADVSVTHVS
jgi:hypothetical protein